MIARLEGTLVARGRSGDRRLRRRRLRGRCARRTRSPRCRPHGERVDAAGVHAVRETEIALFGFIDAHERALFDLLITVKNVGPSTAIAILSGASPRDIAALIAREDVAGLTQDQGHRQEDRRAARRRAAREVRAAGAVVERGGGIRPVAAPAGTVRASRAGRHPLLDEVLTALVGMGWRPAEAEQAVAELPIDDGTDPRDAAAPGAAQHAEVSPGMARKKHIDGPEAAAAESAAREVAPAERGSEKAWQAALRPRTFDEYIGQRDLIENLKVSVRAAKQNGWALDHFLFAGPAGPRQDHARPRDRERARRQPPRLERPGDRSQGHARLAADLARRGRRAVHRRDPPARRRSSRRTSIPAMEDFRFDLFIGDGPHAKAVTMQLPRFTLLGATTRMGLLVRAAARSVRLPLAAPLLRARRHDRRS